MQDKFTILLVGDNPENFPDIGEIADHMGMEFVHVVTIRDAIQACDEEPVALVIADADSPVLDHQELITSMHRGLETCSIPMILAGGTTDDFLPQSADEAPLDFVPGKVDSHLLITRIRLMTDWINYRRRIDWLESENERLESLNKQIKKFVGNVAHDLRSPLGKLINTSEVLLSGVDAEALPTFYDMLVQTSRRGFNLVNDILDLTALESGQVKLFFEKCDLSDVASQVVSELGYLAADKEISLVIDIQDKRRVRADRRRIFQVIGNLVSNAIKFTPRQGKITLQTIPLETNLEINVRDTGVGIARDKLASLFFKHEKNSTLGTEGEQGTGFGLPLAQEIALAHGARIKVTSQENVNTCFSFQLPFWSAD